MSRVITSRTEEVGELRCEQGSVAYRLRFSRRRTLAVHVFADGRVELRAPLGCSRASIEAFLRDKREWVWRKRMELAARPTPPAPDFSDGSLHFYLGKACRLRVDVGRPARVEHAEGELRVLCGPGADVPALVRSWYRRRAGELFGERLASCHAGVAPLGVPLPRLGIRVMRSRWGSCSRRGRVNLNLELIKYPVELIDYVITHELCHFLEFNHGPRFYAHMDRLMSDWRQRKKRLDELARVMVPFDRTPQR